MPLWTKFFAELAKIRYRKLLMNIYLVHNQLSVKLKSNINKKSCKTIFDTYHTLCTYLVVLHTYIHTTHILNINKLDRSYVIYFRYFLDLDSDSLVLLITINHRAIHLPTFTHVFTTSGGALHKREPTPWISYLFSHTECLCYIHFHNRGFRNDQKKLT